MKITTNQSESLSFSSRCAVERDMASCFARRCGRWGASTCGAGPAEADGLGINLIRFRGSGSSGSLSSPASSSS